MEKGKTFNECGDEYEDDDDNEEEQEQVQVKSKHENRWMSLNEFLEQDSVKSRHEYIRENVLTLTRIYNHRVKAFIREIILGKNNPMCVSKFTYKTEFQNRGAGHIHGTLWVNMSKIENFCQLKSGELIAERELSKPYIQGKIQNSHDSADEVRKRKPFKGLKEAFRLIRKGEDLDYEQGNVITRFVDAVTTVSLCPAEVGEEVARIAKEVNEHRHTITCKKHVPLPCRFRYPRYPSERTILSGPPTKAQIDQIEAECPMEMSDDEDCNNKIKVPAVEKLKQRSEKVLKKVRNILEDDATVKEILGMWSKGSTVEEYQENRRLRIGEMLKRAEVSEEDYYKALEYNHRCYEIIQKRDLDEIMINSYNPEWLKCWNGNIDVQVCVDFFSVITYITEYYAKDETKTMEVIKQVLDSNPDEPTRERMKKVANTFMRSRQIGEAEGFYKLLPDLLLKNSNVSCQWLSLENPADKVKRMRRADEKVTQPSHIYKEIEGSEGLWKEQPDMVSKWLRRQGMESDQEGTGWADPTDVSLAQFAKMYTPSRSDKTKQRDGYQNHNKQHDDIYPEAEDQEVMAEIDKEEDDEDPEAKFHLLMWGHEDPLKENQHLPMVIKIKDPLPDELPFLRKRKYPAVLRFNKSNRYNKPARFFQGEIMLYCPDWTEDLFTMSEDEVLKLYEKKKNSIDLVKKQVMEHLEDVEEARHFVNEANKRLDLNEIGGQLDPENEQLNADLEGEDELHPEYQHLDPGYEDEPREVTIYRRIEVPNKEVLYEATRRLDPFQRMVVDKGVKYARDLIKAEKPENKRPKPPHLMVHGGAGAGKTTVIRTLVQHIELILRKPGDETGLPYVIKTAPTGAAASLIEGMTLHKAFNFDFSGKFHSLSDKMRDKKRSELRNLKIVIVDEVSMVKADMLYQLCLRLQEIKERPQVPFGGVCLMCFGDIMQLRPVMGTYPFQRPRGEQFQVMHDLASRWHMFTVINLEENHRQGEDKEYADLLNRMRTDSLTKKDLDTLQGRVRKIGHPVYKDIALYIVCTKKTAHNINTKYLKRQPGEEIILKATHVHALQKQYKPKIDNIGEVGKTGFADELNLKVGCRVMLIQNIEVADCLTNGQLGTLTGTVKAENGKIKMLIVDFKNMNVGKMWREQHPQIAAKYPKGTGIEMVSMTYSLTDKSAANITVIQYPLKLAYAVTAHKIQGQSIPKPLKVALDICGTFQAAQAYVMFSRVEDISQVVIMDRFSENNIKTDHQALEEMEKMNNRSLNNNPTPWMKIDRTIRIAALNIMNLRNNLEDVSQDPTIRRAHIINLSETWVRSQEDEKDLQIEGYQASFNSAGPGKGIVTFYNPKVFTQQSITHHRLTSAQITMFQSHQVDVIHVYRSQQQLIGPIIETIQTVLNPAKTTVVCGDFNICLKKYPNNQLIQHLTTHGMTQLNQDATHIAGGHIDHMYISKKDEDNAELERYSPYYSDHDALLLSVKHQRGTIW